MPTSRPQERPSGPARAVRAAFLLLLAAWTLYWAVQGVRGILSDTGIGRGEAWDGLAFYQVWELSFVSASYLVRWLPGAVVLGFPVVAGPLLRGMRRLRRWRLASST